MINELYQLSEAIDKAGVQTQCWHKNYKPIPNIKEDKPCVSVLISEGKVIRLSAVKKELGSVLRKYGTNQGTYPCMNLAPLYRISDDAAKKALSELCRHPELLDSAKIDEIKSWCHKNNYNWGNKFRKKYRISMRAIPETMLKMVSGYEPLKILVEESNYFLEPDVLHEALESEAIKMLHNRKMSLWQLKFCFWRHRRQRQMMIMALSPLLLNRPA
jgi:hypothetical protein